MNVGLGIDGGGSSSRWLLLAQARSELEATVLAAGRVGPISGSGDRLDAAAAQLTTLLEAAKAVVRPDALVAGVTGLHPGTEPQRRFAERVAAVLGLEPQRVRLADDMHVAYATAFAPGEGVLLYAGTGSIAYHERVSGAVVRAGGYGYLIDDAGGGFWIGRAGLRWLFRQVDARGTPADTLLAGALYEALGSRVWDELVPRIYGGGRTFVAALAPAVAAAADSGDADAQEILGRAAAELARLVRAVEGQLGQILPVAFAGGITRLSPLLQTALTQTLGRPAQVVTLEPVQAAARLALNLALEPISPQVAG